MKDNRKNLISIVVPFYNAEEKIELLIESILNQDLANVEFVFVNDGSIDNTEGKVKEKLENCAIDFKFINKANGGVSSARNLGLNSVIGQYVMFVDSDDALLPNVIQMIKKEIRVNNEPDVLMFEYLRYKNDEKEKCLTYIVDDNQSQERENKYTDPSLLLERYLSGELIKQVSVCSCVYSVDFLSKNKVEYDESYSYGEDQKFIIDCLFVLSKVAYNNKPVLAYIDYSDSATGQYNEKWFDSYQVFKSYYSREEFFSYGRILNVRMNEELLTISNKIILQSGFSDSLSFIKDEIIPLKRKTNRIAFFLLFSLPIIYVLLYKAYKMLK